MKKIISVILLLSVSFLGAFPASLMKYHTWFILTRCMNVAAFESAPRIEFLKILSLKVENKKEEPLTFTNKNLLHQNKLVTGLSELTTEKSAIFCTTQPLINEVTIDIYSEEMNFDRREVGELCRSHFDAKAHNLAYTIP